MTVNVGSVFNFVAQIADPAVASLAAAEIKGVVTIGLRMGRGCLIVRNNHVIPVIDGKTCIDSVREFRADKYDWMLEIIPRVTQKIENALFVPGSRNYYHFVANNMPSLVLLNTLQAEDNVHLAHVGGFPPNANGLMAKVLPRFAGNRSVTLLELGDGDYAVENVIFRAMPNGEVVVAVARLLLSFVARLRGLSLDSLSRDPIKIFVQRNAGINGRNLRNQAEIEGWLMDRGYISIDPGTLAMEDQMLLFARATHIVSVEGAALTNLVFAPNALSVLALTSPLLRGESFFSDLAKASEVPFKSIYGSLLTPEPTSRHEDFVVTVGQLAAELP